MITLDLPEFNPGNVIWEKIREAMKPFKLGYIYLEMDNRWFEDNDVLMIRASTFPDLEFHYHILRADWVETYATSDRTLAEDIGLKAGQFFASQRIEPESNIDLGYN